MNSTTNQRQFEYLVSWMCKHPVIARSYRKSFVNTDISSIFDKLTVELNQLGPPEKPTETWRRVWSDYKHNIKKKIISSHETGRLTIFSARDQRVIDLLDLKQFVRDDELIDEEMFSMKSNDKSKRQKLSDDSDDDINWNEGDSSENTVSSNAIVLKTDNSFGSDQDQLELMQENATAQTSKLTNNISQMLQKRTTNKTKKSGNKEDTETTQEQSSMLKMLTKIERQLDRLNETEAESNKLLKLLLYRTTEKNDDKDDTNKTV